MVNTRGIIGVIIVILLGVGVVAAMGIEIPIPNIGGKRAQFLVSVDIGDQVLFKTVKNIEVDVFQNAPASVVKPLTFFCGLPLQAPEIKLYVHLNIPRIGYSQVKEIKTCYEDRQVSFNVDFPRDFVESIQWEIRITRDRVNGPLEFSKTGVASIL